LIVLSGFADRSIYFCYFKTSVLNITDHTVYNVGRAARLQAVRSGIRFPTGTSYFLRFPNLHIGPRGLLRRPV
jgi:hypothetical protein